jgi:uncharacterized paraquat-inducible protein A
LIDAGVVLFPIGAPEGVVLLRFLEVTQKLLKQRFEPGRAKAGMRQHRLDNGHCPECGGEVGPDGALVCPACVLRGTPVH